jgi:hypothetical protein
VEYLTDSDGLLASTTSTTFELNNKLKQETLEILLMSKKNLHECHSMVYEKQMKH